MCETPDMRETKSPEPSCRQVDPLLDDLIDGQLSEGQQEAVRRHLAGCQACREQLASLERLLDEVAALPRAVEVPRDLWSDIEPRLTERPMAATSGRWPDLRQVAAALLFMTLGGVLTHFVQPALRRPVDVSNPQPSTTVQTVELMATERRADFALAEADYLRAKEALWSAVYSNRQDVSPVTRDVVERNLEVIDQAIRELRAALHVDPGNHQLENLLLGQHRTEIDLLQRLALRTSEI